MTEAAAPAAPTEAQPAAPSAAPAAPAPAAELPWHGITDPEVAAYVTNKGWQSAADVIKSYQGAEKLIGRDPSQVLIMPRADDPDGIKAVFAKLGMPESPDKYDVKVGLPQGASVDENFAKSMQGLFHQANLTDSQAKALAGGYNQLLASLAEQQAKDYELNVEADKKSLMEEWRGGHERMMNLAKNAAQTLGFTGEAIDAMEKTMGYAGTYKFLADLGKKLGEDSFVSPATKTAAFEGMMTPEEAKSAWDQTKLDPNFMAALRDPSHPGHKAAQEKQTKLFRIMYPEGQ